MQYNDNELIYMIKEDEEALNFLIEKYEPLFRSLSYSFAKKYSYRGIEVEDLVQQCRITLCKVVDRYDYNREVLFYSYLLVCLKGAILKYCRKYHVKTDNFNYMEVLKKDINELQLKFYKIKNEMRRYLKYWIENNINNDNIYLKLIKKEIENEEEKEKIKEQEVINKYKENLNKLINYRYKKGEI